MTDKETVAEAPAKKSIVPSKYSGKYKGAADSVAEFIKTQTEGNFASFAALARKNGVAETQVAKYEGLVADKANNHGIEGRARMTLGNMIRSIARKEGKLTGLNGDVTEFTDLAKPVLSGAAAGAAAAAEAKAETAPETETVGDSNAPTTGPADEATE